MELRFASPWQRSNESLAAAAAYGRTGDSQRREQRGPAKGAVGHEGRDGGQWLYARKAACGAGPWRHASGRRAATACGRTGGRTAAGVAARVWSSKQEQGRCVGKGEEEEQVFRQRHMGPACQCGLGTNIGNPFGNLLEMLSEHLW
ncbi:hypothetical protein BRADI_2g59720v3 [Brachypodium distachyon]|uniref:Uncharacterized protein n=1 Tax=Brachypodium distachyon TaxID=15368 RepID=I1HUV8_BRADI|nr:hypothetical protein BRADI_2g59720v3 [Brachypodium distachyon]